MINCWLEIAKWSKKLRRKTVSPGLDEIDDIDNNDENSFGGGLK